MIAHGNGLGDHAREASAAAVGLVDGGPAAQPQPLTVTAIIPATNAPTTLDRCLESIRAALDGPEQVIVVERPAYAGPASARNAGARFATGNILVFVDSDVEIHPDAFRRIRSTFRENPGLTAVFGSYDDGPYAAGLVSPFRNLLHHHVHQSSPGRATTFWAGLGAIRRHAFEDAGGFDAERFKKSSVEDIELGLRLTAAGATIELDPSLQGRHLKAWTLGDMLRTDFARRGTPWVRVLLNSRTNSSALNLAWRHRLSSGASLIGVGSLLARRPAVSGGALLALLLMNRSFYGLLVRRRGPVAATAGVGLHILHCLAAAASVPAGIATHFITQDAPVDIAFGPLGAIRLNHVNTPSDHSAGRSGSTSG